MINNYNQKYFTCQDKLIGVQEIAKTEINRVIKTINFFLKNQRQQKPLFTFLINFARELCTDNLFEVGQLNGVVIYPIIIKIIGKQYISNISWLILVPELQKITASLALCIA